MVRGWGIEGMWTALPTALAADAYAFLNQDFNTAFGLRSRRGRRFWHLLHRASSYQGQEHVLSTSGDSTSRSTSIRIPAGVRQRLVPAERQPVLRLREPTNKVDSRCAGFGLARTERRSTSTSPTPPTQSITNYDRDVHGNLAVHGRLADLLAAEHARLSEPGHVSVGRHADAQTGGRCCFTDRQGWVTTMLSKAASALWVAMAT